MAQNVRKPAQPVRVNIGDKSYTFKFGNLALLSIEKEWHSINKFMAEFEQMTEGNEDIPVMRIMCTVVIAGLAHAGYTMRDLDSFPTEDLQDAFEPIMQAFAESFGMSKADEQGEAPAAPEAA